MLGHVSAMEQALGRRFDAIVVSGGGSRADVMMQIVADVFDRTTCRTDLPDAAGLGAAICAAVGVGVHPDWDTAVDMMVPPGRAFQPDPANAATYRRIGRSYARLTEFTDPLFTWTSQHQPD